MKTFISVFIITLTAYMGKAQNNDLVGTWNIIECAYTSGRGTEKILEDEIKAGATVTNFLLMDNGKFQQTSNTSGTGTLDTYDGTWSVSDHKLTITLNFNDHSTNIEWNYELKDNLLVLSRRNPSGTLTITNIFRKK